MSRLLIRRCIAFLLVVLLPLQAAAASRLVMCAEMEAQMRTAQTHSIEQTEHCAQMASMPLPPSPSSTDKSSTTHSSGCWLGSTCLAGMMFLALPATFAGVHIERNTPFYLPHTTLYRSIISESPLRPPTTL